VNQVNSGGALVDSFGHLVGLNTAPFLNKSTVSHDRWRCIWRACIAAAHAFGS